MKPISLVQKVLLFSLIAAILFLSLLLFKNGHPFLAGGIALLSLGTLYIFASPKAYTYRYLYPSLMAFGLFVITPLVYTFYIAFTNYSDQHRLTEQAVREHFLKQKTVNTTLSFDSKLYKDGNTYQVLLTGPDISVMDGSPNSEVTGEDVVVDTTLNASSSAGSSSSITENKQAITQSYLSEPFKLASLSKDGSVSATISTHSPAGKIVFIKDLITIKEQLANLEIKLTPSIGLTMDGLSRFSPVAYNWILNDDKSTLTQVSTRTQIFADKEQGYFVDDHGTRYGPGFKTLVGFDQFKRIVTDPVIQKPFFRIFTWTILFAVITTILIFFLGFLLSVILQWPGLKGRAVWRTMLILPYAVPAFISILVFKGLFNPQFGEINAMLMALFGISPEWTTDPLMAKTMVLLVNLWLGYPYMMILTMGLLQSIPTDIYEASAIDGGNPINDTLRLTLPLILKPMKPLLITTFAFNFNNFLLINLLTNGAPQMKGVSGVVGETDLLVTYTYNLAFMSGNNYALASAISVIIFIIVGLLAYFNLKVTMKEEL